MSLADRIASSRTIRLFCLIAIAALALLRLPSDAQEYFGGPVDTQGETNEPKNQPAAVASDLNHESAEEVAKELLRIQQQLGGSIVNQSPQLSEFRDPVPSTPASTIQPPRAAVSNVISPPQYLFAGPAVPMQATPLSASQKPASKVVKLREAAWQLDTTANCLENLDLYDQADALRGLSSRLRRDAREMKQQANSAAIELSSFELPPEF